MIKINLLSDSELDNPDKKHNFFIIEIGREKESYHYYFYNEAGVDLTIFLDHIKKTAQKAASILVNQYTNNLNLNCKKVDDFTIHFNAIEHMIDFGYEKFEPPYIILEDNPFNFNMDSLLFRNKNKANEQNLEKDNFVVFLLSEWDGFYHDSIKNQFFYSNNSFPLAHSIVLSEFKEISNKISNQNKTQLNNENGNLVVKELESLLKQFFQNVNDQLLKNGFNKVFFHNTFLYCNYSFSDKLITVIGEDNYERLKAFNQEIDRLNKSSSAHNPPIDNDDNDLDLPF